MLNPFVDDLGKYLQFFIILIWLLMIVFAIEVIVRVGGRISEKGKKIFTVIYVTTGSCMALLMVYSFRWQLLAEIKTCERIMPWIIGFALSAITAVLIPRSSGITK